MKTTRLPFNCPDTELLRSTQLQLSPRPLRSTQLQHADRSVKFELLIPRKPSSGPGSHLPPAAAAGWMEKPGRPLPTREELVPWDDLSFRNSGWLHLAGGVSFSALFFPGNPLVRSLRRLYFMEFFSRSVVKQW